LRLDELDLAQVERLLPQLEDLRHDLGKYIQFEQRFLEEPVGESALRRALCADLLATRRGAQGSEAAWQVWERQRPAALDGDPDVARIDACMVQLLAFDPASSLDVLHEMAGVSRVVAASTRDLLQRARDLLPPEQE
jgi:hypothetical protein